MTTILVAADAEWVRNQVRTAFVGPGQQVVEVTQGPGRAKAAVRDHHPDLVVLDLQIANMGGIAVAIDLRNEESGGRLPHSTILLLLDREADRFLAARADVEGVLVKPVDPGTLRRAAKALLERAARSPRPTSDDDDEPDRRARPLTSSQRGAAIARRAGELLLEVRAAAEAEGVDDKTTRSRGDLTSNDLILAELARATRRRGAVGGVEGRPGPARPSGCGSSTRSTARASSPSSAAPTGPCTSRSSAPVRRSPPRSRFPRSARCSRPRRRPCSPPAHGGAPRLVVSRTRPPKITAHLAGVLGAELVPMGSAGAKTMAVVRGEVDVYAHGGGQYEWDSAAPVGVAAAAGLHVSRLDGSPLVYNQPDPYLPDLLVCRPELAAAVLAAIASAPPE